MTESEAARLLGCLKPLCGCADRAAVFGRCSADTPIWKLEAALKCRSCNNGRYPPPVDVIKLTTIRDITPYP